MARRDGEVLDILVQSRRNKKTALKLMRKLLKKQGSAPDAIVTDNLPSHGAALRDIGLSKRHETGGGKNNRAENSPLRAAIAEHLRNARGVRCDPEQVIVTAGSQQSFALSALALLDPGDLAWGEDPGHAAGRDILTALGISVAPVPIDEEGLSVAEGRSRVGTPRLIFVTPSHQHPLGVTMSLRRCLELLQFAQQSGAWILEDDYDSEFRYSGRLLPALQGLDDGERVIYAGSFSKVLIPPCGWAIWWCPTAWSSLSVPLRRC